MTWLKLMKKSGDSLWVNMRTHDWMDRSVSDEDGVVDVTTIYVHDGSYLEVRETPEQIMEMLRAAGKGVD